jgi:hypothetical protein
MEDVLRETIEALEDENHGFGLHENLKLNEEGCGSCSIWQLLNFSVDLALSCKYCIFARYCKVDFLC